jgi:DNA mismatch repair protein MutS2
VARERAAAADTEKKLRAREETLRDREDALRRRLDAKLDDQLRAARREIDVVIEGLKTRAAELTEKASRRLVAAPDRIRAAGITTGDTGAVRGDARAALDEIVGRLKDQAGMSAPAAPPAPVADVPLAPGVRVTVAGLGLEGTIVEVHGKQAEIDVRGKRLRAPLRDLRAIGGHAGSASGNLAHGNGRAGAAEDGLAGSASRNPAYGSGSRNPAYGSGRAGAAESGPIGTSRIHVNVSLQPREGMLSELNVIGCTVDEALTRAEKFLDQSTMGDQQVLRIVHGHGSGQLRRAIGEFLRNHPLVARYELAPQDQGGGGATIIELKD